uniref:Uncharacterized protein n=1 Tax=Ditylenchus dipsaci TaxID=166011 RepID=A0A915DCC6_9BILA
MLFSDGVDPGASSPGCIAPADMMLLYKLCIGLCFLFVLGCCCNIIFCCMSRNVGWSPKHNNKKKQNKRLAISTTGSFQHQRPFSALTTTTSTLNPHGHKNEYWIQDTGREQNEPSFYSSHYGELPVNTTTDNGNNRRNSLTSYASVKQRGNRLQDSVHTTHFRLSNSGSDGVSIRPYGPPPSTSPSANSGALRSTIYDQSSTYHPPNSTTFHTNDPTFSSSTSGSVASSMLAEEQEMGDKHQDGQTQEQGVGGPHRVAPLPPPATTTFITMTGTQPNFKARPSGEYEVMAQQPLSRGY